MLLASISSGGGAPALIAACTGILAGKQSVWGDWMYFVASHSSSSGRLPGECHMAGNGRGPHAWPSLSGTCKSGNGRRGHHVEAGLHIASPHQLEIWMLAIKFIK